MKMGPRGVVGKSVSNLHHHHSACEETERQMVYGDAGMSEMDWVTGSYGDTGVMEIGCSAGSPYSGDPRVDRSHLKSSYNTTN
jgi:hypothetical protein